MSASMPMRAAWQATAWAWLPADMATTPRARSSASRESSLFSAPRSLKAAVNCRFSNFTTTWAPRMSDSTRECELGVRVTASAMRLAAARTSSAVTVTSLSSVTDLLGGCAPVPDRCPARWRSLGHDALAALGHLRQASTRSIVLSVSTSGSGDAPMPGPAGTGTMPSAVAGAGSTRSAANQPRGSRSAGRVMPGSRGEGEVGGPAQTRLEHPAHPDRESEGDRPIVDAARGRPAADPGRLEAEHLTRADRDGGLEAAERGDGLVEAHAACRTAAPDPHGRRGRRAGTVARCR